MSLEKRGDKGFTLFELFVAAIVLGVLALFLLDRVLTYQEMAEKTAVEMTIMNMRTGLRYQVAEFMVHNQDNEIAGLVGENPVKWLDPPPPNYIGELKSPRWDEIPPGNWYFDPGTRELCYRIKRKRNFVPGKSGKQGLCLRVTPLSRNGVTLTLVEQNRLF